MLWVLKRTVSMRRFFCAPKMYVKTDGWDNIYNFNIFCLSKPVGDLKNLAKVTKTLDQLMAKYIQWPNVILVVSYLGLHCLHYCSLKLVKLI